MMFQAQSWRVGTVLLVSLGMITTVGTPLLLAKPGVAQYTSPYANTAIIPAGTIIPVEYDQAEKIILAPDESLSLTLVVARDVIGDQGDVLIPAGTEVIGDLEPVAGGTRFTARRLVFRDGRRTPLDANSEIINRKATIDSNTNRAIFRGAVIGAAAATLISAITGDRAIATEEVLRGAGIGALAGIIFKKSEAEVIIIYPDNDLDLSVRSDLVLPRN